MTDRNRYRFHNTRAAIVNPTAERQAAAVAAYRKRQDIKARNSRLAAYAVAALSIVAAFALFYSLSN
jgi:hypothetical protein